MVVIFITAYGMERLFRLRREQLILFLNHGRGEKLLATISSAVELRNSRKEVTNLKQSGGA